MKRKHLIFALVISFSGMAFSQPQAAPGASGICNVREFGATGNGFTLETSAISRAVRACAANGGGTVLFPPGRYLTGTFELQSNITLKLDSGAEIIGSSDTTQYGNSADFGLGKVYGENSSGEGDLVGIIIGRNVHNVSIVGPGAIDGNGDAFMELTTPHIVPDFDPRYTRNPEKFADSVRDIRFGPIEPKQHGAGRPGTLIIFYNSQNILVRDVTIRSAPNWTLHLQNVEQAVISGVHIQNNPLIPNNDGIDCMRCKHVHVSDCDIQTGDDDFAIVASEHINVTNCSMSSRSAAIRLESTKLATFENLSIDANRGIGIFHRGDSKQPTEDVFFSNIVIRTRLIPGHWWGKAEPIYIAVRPCEGKSCAPAIRNVSFLNINADSDSGAVIYGAQNSRVENLTLDGVRLRIQSPPAELAESVGGNFDLRWTANDLRGAIFQHDIPGLYCRHVTGLRVKDLSITWKGTLPAYFSQAISCADFGEIQIEKFAGKSASGKGPSITLTNGDIATFPPQFRTPAAVRLTNVKAAVLPRLSNKEQ